MNYTVNTKFLRDVYKIVSKTREGQELTTDLRQWFPNLFSSAPLKQVVVPHILRENGCCCFLRTLFIVVNMKNTPSREEYSCSTRSCGGYNYTDKYNEILDKWAHLSDEEFDQFTYKYFNWNKIFLDKDRLVDCESKNMNHAQFNWPYIHHTMNKILLHYHYQVVNNINWKNIPPVFKQSLDVVSVSDGYYGPHSHYSFDSEVLPRIYLACQRAQLTRDPRCHVIYYVKDFDQYIPQITK